MLKKIFSLLVIIISSTNLPAQKTYTSADVFTEKNIAWYGIDFTHCKFIGQPAIHGKFYKEPDYVIRNYFKEWNLIVVKEAEKYNVKEIFNKEYVYYDLDTLIGRNAKYPGDSLISFTNTYKLNASQVPQIVSTYSGITKEGIGAAYIVESFNHENDMAVFYVVVFDIATKKVLMQEYLTGRAAGGNYKTFWAHAIFEAMEKNRKVYKKWKKQAMVK